jgi:MFS family permease
MGLWHMTWSCGMLLGPVMGTWIYERSRNALWVVCLILGLVGGALALMKAEPRKATLNVEEAT